jgi:hypothetical protein
MIYNKIQGCNSYVAIINKEGKIIEFIDTYIAFDEEKVNLKEGELLMVSTGKKKEKFFYKINEEGKFERL